MAVVTPVEFLRQDWPKSKLTIVDLATWSNCSIHYDGSIAVATDANGTEIGRIVEPVIWRNDAKHFDLVTDDATWNVEVGGCGCGG